MQSRSDWLSSEPRPKPSPRYLRQVWLQIYLPLLVGLLALIGLVVFVRGGGIGTASVWADASTVFLLIPVIILGLLLTLVCVALSVGLGYLIGWLPGPIRKGWEGFLRVESTVRRGADTAARPMIAAKGLWASLRAAVASVTSIFRAE